MWVVKIGGSLQDSDCLTDWLNRLIEHGAGKVVIVPGGGKFADAVRQAQRRDGFDDVKAHKMALRAMEQYARLLVSIAPELEPVSDLEGIYASLENKKIVLWMPYELIEKNQELPASWAVTSDALSVWLALELNFKSVILVKSVSLPEHYSGLSDLVERELIDPFSIEILGKSNLDVRWMHKSDSDLLIKIMNEEEDPDFGKLINRQKHIGNEFEAIGF